MRFTPFLSAIGVAASLSGPASAQEANRILAGIWPDELLVFDQEALAFEKIGTLRRGAATNHRRAPDGRFFAIVTDRMETVEVFDAAEMAVVDEFRLSTPGQRIRFVSATPGPGARQVFLVPVVVDLEPDRFLRRSASEIWVFDRERREITHRKPLGDADDWRPGIHFAPDGSSVYLLGEHLVELDAETLEERDRIPLDRPLAPGYGGVRGHRLHELEPGQLFGMYRTTEPRQGMDLFGVLEIRLPEKTFTRYEIGPELSVSHFALSPDGRRGYVGLTDAAVIDMESRRVILRKKGFERGRTNNSVIVSADGRRLFVSGVGDTMYVYDAETLEREAEIFAGGDFMMPPTEIRYRGPARNPAGN